MNDDEITSTIVSKVFGAWIAISGWDYSDKQRYSYSPDDVEATISNIRVLNGMLDEGIPWVKDVTKQLQNRVYKEKDWI